MRFLIITPAKNEAQYLSGLIESMAAQTTLPAKWVIVDDGSTDETVSIIKEYQKKYTWLYLEEKNTPQEQRSGGSKVVRAFYHGYEKHKDCAHDVVMKLDADLTLPSNYLERISDEFREDKSLGICGGYCVIPSNGSWQKEESATHHVRGALKAYNAQCFTDIGGITETWNWDGIDGMTAMHKGWTVRNIDLAVKHHRPTTAAYEPTQHAYRSGVEAYRTGNDLMLTLIRGAFKLKSAPFVKNSIQYIKGFMDARKRKEPKVVDEALAKFIKQFTYKRILSLKRL
jgi:glycosyltransferase involved in cell wall biosynthesis